MKVKREGEAPAEPGRGACGKRDCLPGKPCARALGGGLALPGRLGGSLALTATGYANPLETAGRACPGAAPARRSGIM